MKKKLLLVLFMFFLFILAFGLEGVLLNNVFSVKINAIIMLIGFFGALIIALKMIIFGADEIQEILNRIKLKDDVCIRTERNKELDVLKEVVDNNKLKDNGTDIDELVETLIENDIEVHHDKN